MGDFNCNLASPQPHIKTVLLTNIVDIYNLYQLIDSPTRITNTSSTLIDVIFTHFQNNIVSTGVSHVSLGTLETCPPISIKEMKEVFQSTWNTDCNE